MVHLKSGILFPALAGLAMAGFVGCAGVNEPEPSATAESEADGAPAAEVVIPDEMSGIAELPASEQSAALAQEICPVSDEPLGSMGMPIKVAAGGQDMFVCCDSCVDTVKENPDKYLAKLTKE